jgi:hypothetical protein
LLPAAISSSIFRVNTRLASNSIGWLANISRPLVAARPKPATTSTSAARASGCSGSAGAAPSTRSSTSTRLPSSKAMPTRCTTSRAG